MNAVFITALVMFGGYKFAQATMPEWAKLNSHSVSGKILKTVCSGTGPSIDIARKDALDSCRLSARQQLVTSVKVRSLTIQTEKSSGFHEEVTENTQYTGLTCTPERDEVEEFDGSFKIWMECRFDLSMVKAVTDAKTEMTQPLVEDSHSAINGSNFDQLKASGTGQPKKKYIRDQKGILSIASIPRCESLIIRGVKPRVINCKQNPVQVILESGDREIIVRAKGYEPKTILLNEEKKSHESIQVTLDLL